MEKKIIQKLISDDNLNLDIRMSIDELISEIESYKKRGATHVEISLEIDSYDPDDSLAEISYYEERMETEEESIERLAKEERLNKRQEEYLLTTKNRRREQYLELKKEFEPETQVSQ